MFKKPARCKKCKEQYSLPQFAIRSREIVCDCICPKCAEEQRSCRLKEKESEGKCRILEKENEVAIEQEEQKRITLCIQQKHDQKEAEQRRLHEIELEIKKAETAKAQTTLQIERNKEKNLELKIQEQHTKQKELEAEMLEERNRHEADMHDRCSEETLLEMQEQRTEQKRLDLEYLQIRLKESALGSPPGLRNAQWQNC